ncbi:MAG: GTP-binding protein, partial [Syntrophales bacterium]|nr:GTP-binding protein [Syntrophales bacterium]
DYEPEEQKRHISISAATNFFEWNKCKVNIIDTPGDANFAYDTQSCLRVSDGAVVVIDAVSGVEFQTQKVWEYADEFHLPRIVFINRMDRERADFYKAVESIGEKIKAKVTPVFLPIGKEEGFKGVVDLISMKALIFDGPKGGYQTQEIPAAMVEEAQKYRETMVEDIAETDETLMEAYLEAGELSPEELRDGLRKAVMAGAVIPVVCGAATKVMGTVPLMDLVTACMPSPADRGPAVGKAVTGEGTEEREPEETAPFSAMVFKTIADPYAGRLTLFRVYSGTLSADSHIYNATRKITERLGGIFFLEGKVQKAAETVIAGDIAAVAKLKETATGDTLCTEKAPIIYEKVPPPPTIMSFAIEPKSRGDEEKITNALNRLLEEDPTMRFYRCLLYTSDAA